MRALTLSPALTLLTAIAFGSCMDATIKYLAHSNHVLLVTFARYSIGAVFSMGIWLHAGRPGITAEMWRAHTLRGFVITIAATTFFWALTVLPLAEAVTLTFIYPLVVPFAARVMLGEQLRASSLVTAVIGFVGVVIAAQGGPSAQESPMHTLGVISVLISACSFAVAMTLLRQRAQMDGAVIVGLMTSLIPAFIIAGPAIALSPPPRVADWPFFIQLGALAAGFMYLMAAAYARAEAQQLAPIHYTELLWASTIGFFIFHETPRVQIFAGAALIIAACVFTAYEERRLARRAPA